MLHRHRHRTDVGFFAQPRRAVVRDGCLVELLTEADLLFCIRETKRLRFIETAEQKPQLRHVLQPIFERSIGINGESGRDQRNPASRLDMLAQLVDHAPALLVVQRFWRSCFHELHGDFCLHIIVL